MREMSKDEINTELFNTLIEAKKRINELEEQMKENEPKEKKAITVDEVQEQYRIISYYTSRSDAGEFAIAYAILELAKTLKETPTPQNIHLDKIYPIL